MPRSDPGRPLIPALPTFVDFLPSPAPPARASDTDREITVDMLCAAVADGRLTLAELDERVEAALSARTLRDLAGLIADLFPYRPATRPSPPRRADPGREVPREEASRKEASRDEASRRGVPRRAGEADPVGRWALIQSLVPAEGQPRFA